jgi:hypothetical protein
VIYDRGDGGKIIVDEQAFVDAASSIFLRMQVMFHRASSTNFLIPSLLQFFFRIVLSEEFYQSLLVSVLWSLLKFTQRRGLSGFRTHNVEIYTYQSNTIDSLPSLRYALHRCINT